LPSPSSPHGKCTSGKRYCSNNRWPTAAKSSRVVCGVKYSRWSLQQRSSNVANELKINASIPITELVPNNDVGVARSFSVRTTIHPSSQYVSPTTLPASGDIATHDSLRNSGVVPVDPDRQRFVDSRCGIMEVVVGCVISPPIRERNVYCTFTSKNPQRRCESYSGA